MEPTQISLTPPPQTNTTPVEPQPPVESVVAAPEPQIPQPVTPPQLAPEPPQQPQTPPVVVPQPAVVVPQPVVPAQPQPPVVEQIIIEQVKGGYSWTRHILLIVLVLLAVIVICALIYLNGKSIYQYGL